MFLRQRIRAVLEWAEETDHPREVTEATLAHKVRNPIEAAYRRTDLFERRRRLMWTTGRTTWIKGILDDEF